MTLLVPDPSELSPLSQEELDDIVKRHMMFLKGQNGGARAVLQYRNLSNLDLMGSFGPIFSCGTFPTSFFFLKARTSLAVPFVFALPLTFVLEFKIVVFLLLF